ncbi:uncharacterized protein LOC107494742 [Arachis duranensis]|uniref:Uncharacterized protein LOC107494742 n=1 Tax=Arachis duranensis TaxID=130453 RepID=A0A6P4DNJ6_ARADU|nr:uncharacterized protein LOC107494742 [Arachis duranensis]
MVGKKEITKLTYRMPVAVANSFAYRKMQIKSDQQVSIMFSYHRSIGTIYSLELYMNIQDIGGSSSSSSNVEGVRNLGAADFAPGPDISRARSPSFNAFVVQEQNANLREPHPSPSTLLRFDRHPDVGIVETSDEDDIEEFSGDEEEVVPETQPLHRDSVPPTPVEPVGGGVSSSTPVHYLSLNLGAMHSSNADDRPSSYALSGEMELEIRLKFLNRESAMLAVKNYNIRKSAEYKVVESDQRRYVCRCKQFGDQCRWMVRVAKTKSSRFWEIRKYDGPHSCLASSMSQDHAQLDSNVICQHIFPMVHADATICVKVLQGSVESVYGYKVSYKKV